MLFVSFRGFTYLIRSWRVEESTRIPEAGHTMHPITADLAGHFVILWSLILWNLIRNIGVDRLSEYFA